MPDSHFLFPLPICGDQFRGHETHCISKEHVFEYKSYDQIKNMTLKLMIIFLCIWGEAEISQSELLPL